MPIDPTTYVFNFGQYSFYTYNEVFKIDPTYIYWCVSNLPEFNLDTFDMIQLEKKLGYDK